MNKRALVYVPETEPEKRRRVKESVSKVLADYPAFLLVEADADQIDALRDQGIHVDVQEKVHKIRLRAVEFDPSEIPTPPPSFMLRAAEIEEKSHYWIVQFVGPMKPEWGEKIKELGGKLHGHIPEHALLVNMTPQIKAEVAELPFVEWVGLYEPAYKVSPLLMGRKKRAAPDEMRTLSPSTKEFKPAPEGNITVMLHNPDDLKAISKEIEELGGRVVSIGKDTIRASLDVSQVHKIAKKVEVKWIEPYTLPELFNDKASKIIGANIIWDAHGLDGEGQIVAVADTGLDTGVNDDSMHEDFRGRIVHLYSWKIPGELHPYLRNITWDDGPGDYDSGHGTHVAGSVLGSGARSNGVIRGMAFRAEIVFQAVEQHVKWKPFAERAGHEDGYYLVGLPHNLHALFQQAYDAGARIHSNSWGDKQHGQYTSSARDIDDFVWNHKDMVILFAAGNSGQDANHDGVIDGDSLGSQPCAKNCISVGASENERLTGGYNPGGPCDTYGSCWPEPFPVDPIKDDRVSDNPEGMAAFSSRGPTDDGRIKPDVVAPGTNILSTRSSVATEHGWGLLPPDDGCRPYYMYMGGTSMATPIAAGAVALIRQYLMKNCSHEPSAALVKAVLIHGASPLAGQYNPPEVKGVPDCNQGWGRVDLTNSLFPDPPVKMEFKDDPSYTVGTGEHKEFTFTLAEGAVPFKATLVWTDYPSDPETGGGLVNTLRLSVIPPEGNAVLGSPANNNVQQVTIDNPQPGVYTIQVQGLNIGTHVIIGERQDFALVMSGGLQ